MAKSTSELIDKLNDLIALDIDAFNAYEEALDRMTITPVRNRLRTFQADHQRHIDELSEVVTRFSGEPRQRPDVKGFLIKGFTAITSMMGDEAALRAMKGNEHLTTSTYEKALREDWPEDVMLLIRRNFSDEQRHLAFIEECLRNKPWEKTTQAQM